MIQNLQELSWISWVLKEKINVKYLVLQTRTYKHNFRNTASDFILYETLVKCFWFSEITIFMESVIPNIPMIWYIVSRTRFFHNHNVHNTCKIITNVPDIESLWTTYVNLIIFWATATCMSKSPPYTQKSNEDWKPKLTPFEYTFIIYDLQIS